MQGAELLAQDLREAFLNSQLAGHAGEPWARLDLAGCELGPGGDHAAVLQQASSKGCMHAWAAHSAWASASLLLFKCLPQILPVDWCPAGLWTLQLNCAPVSLPDHRLCMCITQPLAHPISLPAAVQPA